MEIAAGTEKQSEPFLRATGVTLGVLRGAGLGPEHATAIARNLLWTGLALVMTEPGAQSGMSQEERAEHSRRNRVRMAMDRYPHVVECAEPLAACDDPEAHYRFGIDLFIAGAEAVTARLTGRDEQAE